MNCACSPLEANSSAAVDENVSYCHSRGFHAGMGSPKIRSRPPNATAAMA